MLYGEMPRPQLLAKCASKEAYTIMQLASSNFIDSALITGVPRSGTTLCCHLLNQQPNTLALHEPLSPVDFDQSKGRDVACEQIGDFISETRLAVTQQGTAISRHRDGKIPDNIISENGSRSKTNLRRAEISLGSIDVSSRHLDSDFRLFVKHNALFTALLPDLQHCFDVYAVVRNPLAVLISWNTVDLPVNQGRLPAGEKFSAALSNQLENEPSILNRQIFILDWFFSQFRKCIPLEQTVFYEALVTDSKYLSRQFELSERDTFAHNSLADKNASNSCVNIDEIYKGLMQHQRSFINYYSRSDFEELYAKIIKRNVAT
jgi:hypothetical protein